MKTMIWKSSLEGHTTVARMRTRIAFLVLIVGVLATGVFVIQPAITAHAQTMKDTHPNSSTIRMQALDRVGTRLETFVVNGNIVYHKWSDDDGVSWSSWASLGNPGATIQITSSPSLVTDTLGHLQVFVMVQDPSLGSAVYYGTFNNQQWSGWSLWQQAVANIPPDGGWGAHISSNLPFTSMPVFASWGPGRFDAFANVSIDDHGGRALAHTWADNGHWADHWEVLGTGLMQGAPAAVSWGSGRVDVFVRGGGNELDHKWFANGNWSSGWENLGGNMNSSPAVMSWLPNFLAIFARNANGGLSEIMYGQGTWSGWGDLDSNSISADPAVATNSGSSSFHVFALGLNGDLLHRHSINGSWSNWEDLNPPLPSSPAAIIWQLTFPTPPAPTPTPTPFPHRCVQPPCKSEP